MAKASSIISQLMLTLPTLTNLFTDEVSITSLVKIGTTVTATTATPHGYITGQYITIIGARAPLLVTSLTRVGNVASGIVNLSTPHDLTENNPDHDKIYITGATPSGYNVDGVTMLSSVNRYQFQYTVDDSLTTPATGTILLWDGAQRGYNGLVLITVTSPTTFTYQVPGNFLSPYGTIIARSGYRISGAINPGRAEEAYTKQGANKLWGYVVLGETKASKSRENFTDAVSEVTSSSAYLQLEIQRIFFYVFVPITNEIAGRKARDLMEDVRIYLYSSLLRFQPDSGLTSDAPYGIALIGHRQGAYNEAYYVHEFEFEIVNEIIIEDTLIPNIDVAFRDIDLTNTYSPHEPVNLEINLDDIPYVP